MSAEQHQHQHQHESGESRRKRGRGSTVAVIALIEVALLAVIAVALAGSRIALTAEWLEAVPGGRWAVAGVALALLVVAALAMTVLLSK